MLPVEVGSVIRTRRERIGLTQGGLGALVGAAPNLVDQWEWGEEVPNRDEGQRLADVLGVPLDSVIARLEVIVDLQPSQELLIEIVAPPTAPPAVALAPAEPAPGPSTAEVAPLVPKAAPPPGDQHDIRKPIGMVPTIGDFPKKLAAGVRRGSGDSHWMIKAIATALVALLIAATVASWMARSSSDAKVKELEQAAAASVAAIDSLESERDRLLADLESSAAQTERERVRADTAERRIRAAEQEAERVQSEIDAITEENTFLRKAIVVSSASNAVDQVALTIGDGGTRQSIMTALTTLDEMDVTATLFPTGQGLDAFGELWAAAVDRGSELGNSTYSSVAATDVSIDQLAVEMEQWQTAVEAALDREYPTRWFRPPYLAGFVDLEGPEDIRSEIARQGLISALWDVETYFALFSPVGPQVGGSNPGPREVAAHVVRSAQPGSVVVLSFSEVEVAALPVIIEGLHERGLEPVSLTDLVNAQEEMFEGDVAGGGSGA
ncbi:polysaccharide deacetylase family protein [bacterium]|nr:polysaccharide deacetylase family protein [bacterium]